MKRMTLLAALAVLVSGCSESPQQAAAPVAPEAAPVPEVTEPVQERQVTYTEERTPCAHYTENRLPLFGDVHVHTNFSFDAAANAIGATPVDANNFARGEAIPFWPLDEDGKPAGSYQIDRPLDFLAVTDHGEFLGERRICREEGSPSYDTRFCEQTRADQRAGMMLLGQVITTETPVRIPEVCGEDGSDCLEYARGPWKKMAEAAEAAYDKSESCEFTSFVAYEYTGTPGTSNYHRNVIFRNQNVPELPVSYIDAPYDSALWEGLDAACQEAAGCDYLTIPHNSNLANGRMAPYMRLDPSVENRRKYAEIRQDREPIMEIFQHKGGSECINGLSSILAEPDELCDVEAVRFMGREEIYATRTVVDGELVVGSTSEVTRECEDGEIGANGMLGAGCVDATDYHRSGLLVGLAEAQETGVNPVKLGAIAATDTHAASPGAAVESDWRGHVSVEATPEERLQTGLLTSGIDGNPGGLAGVWAMENSRDAIFEAMKRREVWGTSGTRIVPRFFAGWDYPADACSRADLVDIGYAQGVPMGGDLSTDAAASGKPVFIATALRDSGDGSTPLQKLQLVKGWVDADGQMHSSVTDIAGGDNGASVDEQGNAVGGGHESLCVVHTDESFDSKVPSYYYLRVVENPTWRWHMYDCQRLPEDKRPEVCTDGSYPSTVQEMAWTSPVWYQP